MLGILDYNLTEREFEKFKKLIYEKSGINLTNQKKELLKSRLAKRLRVLDITGFSDYYKYLINNDPDGSELVLMLDCISTNKTGFFRENQHFEYLRNTILPELVVNKRAKGEHTFRVWSAGCSSGEEPYTLAIILSEFLNPVVSWDAKILATDISTKVLSKAKEGVYEKEKVKTIPPNLLQKYFEKEADNGTVRFHVKSLLKNLVVFSRFNLMEDIYPFKRYFDIIFCRNVMIYFDKQIQGKITNKFYEHLADGGYFLVGHSESLSGVKTNFHYIRPTIYKK